MNRPLPAMMNAPIQTQTIRELSKTTTLNSVAPISPR